MFGTYINSCGSKKLSCVWIIIQRTKHSLNKFCIVKLEQQFCHSLPLRYKLLCNICSSLFIEIWNASFVDFNKWFNDFLQLVVCFEMFQKSFGLLFLFLVSIVKWLVHSNCHVRHVELHRFILYNIISK